MSTENMIKPSTKATLKRKVGYVDEEASVTRTKFAQMEITQMEIMEENRNGDESMTSIESGPPQPPS